MDDKLNIQTTIIISGIKLRLLSTKRNEYGPNQFFNYCMNSNLNICLNSPKQILKCQFGNISINVI